MGDACRRYPPLTGCTCSISALQLLGCEGGLDKPWQQLYLHLHPNKLLCTPGVSIRTLLAAAGAGAGTEGAAAGECLGSHHACMGLVRRSCVMHCVPDVLALDMREQQVPGAAVQSGVLLALQVMFDELKAGGGEKRYQAALE